MKTILYALDHMKPDQEALSYTLNLCRRMLARLDVLHILPSPTRTGGRLTKLKAGLLTARDAFEKTMVAATFAEAGVPDPETALKREAYKGFRRMLPKKKAPSVNYQCIVTFDAVNDIIERYVHRHREVVLTVLDSPSCQEPFAVASDKKPTEQPSAGRIVRPNLAIPLVCIKHMH
jgi:hypothetical protein